MPLNALSERDDFEVAYDNMLAENTALGFDVVVAQRTNQPGPTALLQKMARSKGGPAVAFEIDDLLTHIHHTNTQAWQHYNRPGAQEALATNMRASDAIICTTERLAEELRAFNDRVFVHPNTIDEEILDLPAPEPNERVTIGWAGGSSHRIDLEWAKDSIRTVVNRHDDVRFRMIGEDFRKVLRLPCTKVDYEPWFPSVLDYVTNLDFDIGIAPLKPTKFNDCKSPIKALEYAARGIPIVASNCGPYADFVRHGETGFLAKTRWDWIDALESLIRDEALRKRMSEAAKAQAAEWTVRKHIGNYASIMEDLVS